MNRILVGLDGSAEEPRVLEAARGLAERLSAKLLLFRAVPLPVEIPAGAFGVPPDALGGILLETAQKHLAEVARTVPPALLGGTKLELGSPWRAICDAAKSENADLIVIGSHGYHGLDRVLGTTAAKVVNHADRSVMVVR